MTRASCPSNAQDSQRYRAEARRRNLLLQGKDREGGVFGASKPIIVFDDFTGDLQWRLRTCSATPEGASKISFAALNPEGAFVRVEREAYTQPQSAEGFHQTTQGRAFDAAIAGLTAAYEKHPDAGNQPFNLHLLHRLRLYARAIELSSRSGVARPSGATPNAMTAAHFQSYLGFLRDAQERVKTNRATPLAAEDAAHITQQLKSLTRYFRDLSLSLPDITDKLATKPSTHTGPSQDLKRRLNDLVYKGLQKLSPQIPQTQLNAFLCAFLHASRCMVSADRSHQGQALESLIDRAVVGLRDLRTEERHPLLMLFARLSERVLARGDTGLVSSLEALLLNPQFCAYVETQANAPELAKLGETLNALLRDPRPALWQSGASLLARCAPETFVGCIEQLIAGETAASIARSKINYLFMRLNQAMEVSDDASAHERYRAFMERLVDVSALHSLTMHGASVDEKLLAARNLQALYNFDAADLSRLELFFSNASFLAGQHFGFNGAAILADIERMLQRARANPVVDLPQFERQLEALADGYQLGLPAVRGLILRALGDSAPPSTLPPAPGEFAQLRPVESWLKDAMLPTYDVLLRLVLGCLPLTWKEEDFSTPHLLADKLLMGPGGVLGVARSSPNAPHLLAGAAMTASDIVDRRLYVGDILNPAKLLGPVEPSSSGAKYYSAIDMHEAFRQSDAAAQSESVRTALTALVSHYRDFQLLNLSDENKTARMHALLAKARAHVQLETGRSRDAAGFKQGLEALGQFLRSVALLGQNILDDEARNRFFVNDTLTPHGAIFLCNGLLATSGDPVAQQAAIVTRLFEIGYNFVRSHLEACPTGASLREALDGLDGALSREIDLQSFRTELVVGSFNTHHSTPGQPRASIAINPQSTEDLRQSLYEAARPNLKRRKIPYIMPNQALAAELCRHPTLEDKNVLLKMGTGQGKSIVIAGAALREAQRLDAGQFVFVLTCYKHLARRDQQTGADFFSSQGVRSACVLNASDVDSLTADTTVIYSDAKTLQQLAQKLVAQQVMSLADPVAYPPSAKRLDFLKKLYTGQHRFILDEYDLVLNDLDHAPALSMNIPPKILGPRFVSNNRQYAPNLAAQTAVDDTRQAKTDSADGTGFSQLKGWLIRPAGGEPYYMMTPGALRVSQLLKSAKRIIGLSGSAAGNTFSEVLDLEETQAEYFELPASRDPSSFGTTIVESKDQLKRGRGIWCANKAVLPASDEQAYIDAVVADVQAAREPCDIPGGEGQQVTRPVLVFTDPDKAQLHDRVCEALERVIPEGQLHEKFKENDFEGERLQEIGIPGRVTLTSVLCGRGADIRVSPNVPDSLHVVIATNLPSQRLRTQVIGRTGRMGQDGSYSEITLGNRVCAPDRSKVDMRPRENLLHRFTGDFVKSMGVACDKDRALRWLMAATDVHMGNMALVEQLSKEFKPQ